MKLTPLGTALAYLTLSHGEINAEKRELFTQQNLNESLGQGENELTLFTQQEIVDMVQRAMSQDEIDQLTPLLRIQKYMREAFPAFLEKTIATSYSIDPFTDGKEWKTHAQMEELLSYSKSPEPEIKITCDPYIIDIHIYYHHKHGFYGSFKSNIQKKDPIAPKIVETFHQNMKKLNEDLKERQNQIEKEI